MSLIFTEQLDKPSQLRSKPSNLLRPIFGALYGFDSTAVAPANTFTTLTIADTDANALGIDEEITFTVQPSVEIAAGGTLTLTGMQGTQTADNASLTVGGAGAAIFGSSGSWTQSTGTLVLTVAGGQSLPTGSNTVITFTLTNSASVQSGKTVSVSSSTFATANATGTILNTVATYNVTTRDTEANILASTPSNPSGEVTNAYGTDTNDLYVYDGSAWYIYNNKPFNSYSLSLDGTDDYMDAGNITAMNSVANASFSFWYKTSEASNTITTLIGDQSNGLAAYQYSDGNMYVHSFVNTAAHSFSNPTSGVWHHIVCTFEASGSKAYLDGSLVSTRDDGNTTNASCGNNFSIGRLPGYNLLSGGKLIDEVALFTSTLSASDVTAIYNSGVPADLTSYSPVGWWRMGDDDSGSGTTITDQGSGGNNGTLTNGPTFSTTVPT